jgi:phenylalanyl-tRNA synthetase beta chain
VKLPISWLRDWIEVDAAPDAIADALTRRGFYVEGIETHGHAYPGIVVARVLEVAKHPNADRLSLCRVDAGQGEIQVVCGAPNVHAGMIAPLATVGATLPGGHAIGTSKIRGVESFGMLCSARELGLGDDHAGILDLAPLLNGGEAPIGRPVQEVFGPPENVLEVEVPFNRPDGLGIVGLAREVKAAFDGRWTEAARARLARRWTGGAEFDLELEDAQGCPRYIAQAIEGVTIGPSPRWLIQRVESVGQRSISNVVDLTNLILFELGQPIHAFDLDRLNGPAIRVRRARAGERLVTLDGKERALDPEVLVIADTKQPVAVAGVMGGAESEVSSASARLLLECAWFDPVRVRKGARFLGLATEASRRYERGVDPEIGPVAAARFVELLRELVPGCRVGAARERDVIAARSRAVALRASRCERLIGMPVTEADAVRQLESFEFAVHRDGNELEVTVPSWRSDVAIEDDLVEEVARGAGYDRIPDAPLETGGVYAQRSDRERLIARARRAMLARGISEAWCTTLVSEREATEAARLLGEESASLVRLSNPMSRDHEVLRPNPVPGLLRACAHNLQQGAAAVRLFEIGAGFGGKGEGLPVETPMIAAILAGPRYAHAHDRSQQPVDFEDAKGIWEAWLEEMSVDTTEWRAYAAPGWKPGASAEVAARASRIGWAGTLSQPLLRGYEIEVPVQLFVGLLDPLRESAALLGLKLPGRFPPVRRDLAFFVPANVSHREVERVLVAAAGDWLSSIELFDVYAGPGTPQGSKSLAYALQFQHPERTLLESEIQSVQDRMAAAVAKECGGRLREK